MGNNNHSPGWNDIGVVISANNNGMFHEHILAKINANGQITDILNTPISGNPPWNHGHGWGINTPNAGSRPPNPYETNAIRDK